MKEGNLYFGFGAAWEVLKYDENGGYYRTSLLRHLEGSKGVDFLCLSRGNQLLIIEAKDFSRGVRPRAEFDKVPAVVAAKVRDTLAGIVGGCRQAPNGNERDFLSRAFRALSVSPRVIYLFEDLATPSRCPPQRTQNKRDVLQKQLRQHLRWLTREVAVVGLQDYCSLIPDLTIRRV